MSDNQLSSDKQIKVSTAICQEKAAEHNPYLAEKLYVAGYDVIDLAEQTSLVDMIFLMFTGELPKCPQDKKLLNSLSILLAIPGPRHPASRSAMACGVSKTNPEHLLPIALMTIGGQQSGAGEVQTCCQFIADNINKSVEEVVTQLVNAWSDKQSHIAPGFGQLYGDIDTLSTTFFKKMIELKPEGKTLQWVSQLIAQLSTHNVGILDVGLAACVFNELSFKARESIGLYQLLRAPGLLALAMEQTHKPVSAIPMLKDHQYELIKK